MKIIYDFPIILIKQSDYARAMKKTWTVKKGAIWVLPDDVVLLLPPTPVSEAKDE